MHTTILAAKRAKALAELQASGEALATQYELDPHWVQALTPAVKDPQVKELRRLEAIADLLEVLAVKTGALDDDETIATETVPADGDQNAPIKAVPDPGAESTDDSPGESNPLPPPVLDEAVATETVKPKRRTKKAG